MRASTVVAILCLAAEVALSVALPLPASNFQFEGDSGGYWRPKPKPRPRRPKTEVPGTFTAFSVGTQYSTGPQFGTLSFYSTEPVPGVGNPAAHRPEPLRQPRPGLHQPPHEGPPNPLDSPTRPTLQPQTTEHQPQPVHQHGSPHQSQVIVPPELHPAVAPATPATPATPPHHPPAPPQIQITDVASFLSQSHQMSQSQPQTSQNQPEPPQPQTIDPALLLKKPPWTPHTALARTPARRATPQTDHNGYESPPPLPLFVDRSPGTSPPAPITDHTENTSVVTFAQPPMSPYTPMSAPRSPPSYSPPSTLEFHHAPTAPSIVKREWLGHIDQRIKLAARAYVRELLAASMDEID